MLPIYGEMLRQGKKSFEKSKKQGNIRHSVVNNGGLGKKGSFMEYEDKTEVIADIDTPSKIHTYKGKKTFNRGTVYKGEIDIISRKPHGKGILTTTDGIIYEGYFVEGRMTGKGKLTYANGEIDEGDFLDGYLHGKGKRTWNDGSVEEGEWRDDEFIG
jgi:hypothetical protein